jgi:hypothetical protein
MGAREIRSAGGDACTTESIINFAVERAIRNHPDQTAREMVNLIRENARLEGELFCLREKLRELAQP